MRFGFDAEVLVRARRQGWTIAEIPVRWRHVEASRVSASSDAARMLYDLLRLRFARHDAEALAPAVETTVVS
jgi:dolichyl-phosphate beta-glucosyltransferase